MTGLNPICQTEWNTFQLMESCLTYLKSVLEFHKGQFLVLCFFLLYLNDLHNSIRFFSPFHFADDTGLLSIQGSMCAISRTLNKDLRELTFWLNANKIALNVAKTEIILSKTSNKNYDADLKIKLCRKRIHAFLYVKYLGIFIDENLNWKIHINKISSKRIKKSCSQCIMVFFTHI